MSWSRPVPIRTMNSDTKPGKPAIDAAGLVAALHAKPRPVVLAVTGGGASAVAALLGVPGASRTVLEAVVPYHERALAEFLGFAPAQACSGETSRAMARRA